MRRKRLKASSRASPATVTGAMEWPVAVEMSSMAMRLRGSSMPTTR